MKTIFLTFTSALCLLAQTTPAGKRPAGTAAKKPVAGRASLTNPAALNAKAPDVYKAKFTTTKGDLVIEVHRDWAPFGADRFYNLVKNGFYDDAAFFRVLPGFMAQFGINPKPAVSKAWDKATIKDDAVKQSNKRGYVSFAKTSLPNSRGTQIFINYGDNSRLDADAFAPFGLVIEGMDVVDKLYSGYGEGAPGGNGPAQDRIESEGKAYLDKNFPQLDSIKTATIISPAGTPATTPAKPPIRKIGPPVKKPAPPKTN
jgi:peptidyl-prolyl cis-trans isomerase A (cyclophilin A)